MPAPRPRHAPVPPEHQGGAVKATGLLRRLV
eukprot:gene20202-biopygen2554